MQSSNLESFLDFKRIGPVRASHQAIAVVFLFLLTVAHSFIYLTNNGTIYGHKDEILLMAWVVIFAPIYEEVLFRGYVLRQLSQKLSFKRSIFFCSLLFGLWHLKNIYWEPTDQLVYQIFYAASFVGPIASFITLRARTIWPAVIFHYLNNLKTHLIWY